MCVDASTGRSDVLAYEVPSPEFEGAHFLRQLCNGHFLCGMCVCPLLRCSHLLMNAVRSVSEDATQFLLTVSICGSFIAISLLSTLLICPVLHLMMAALRWTHDLFLYRKKVINIHLRDFESICRWMLSCLEHIFFYNLLLTTSRKVTGSKPNEVN
jgi:hypothetical protein